MLLHDTEYKKDIEKCRAKLSLNPKSDQRYLYAPKYFNTQLQPQSAVPEPAPLSALQAQSTALLANPYTGLLMVAGLTDPVALTGDAEYQRDLLKRLYPVYDRFVDRFGQAALERHVKYVGAHTSQTPDNLVQYMLKVLTDYERQLSQPKPVKSGRAQISEELPDDPIVDPTDDYWDSFKPTVKQHRS